MIAQRDLEGRLLGLKLRLVGAEAARYLERLGPNGNPPRLPPGAREMVAEGQRGVLCIEGELNAMLSFVALRGSGWGVVGLGSAFGPLPWPWLARLGLPVVIFLLPATVRSADRLAIWTGRTAQRCPSHHTHPRRLIFADAHTWP